MHATSEETVAAAGVGLLRALTEGRGRASIWITLEGIDLEASAALLFPRSATGARGLHIWWGGVAGGVKAKERKSNPIITNITYYFWQPCLMTSVLLLKLFILMPKAERWITCSAWEVISSHALHNRFLWSQLNTTKGAKECVSL